VDSFDSSPSIADGVLYVGEGGYGGLFALDPATGAEQWRFDTHGATWASPTVADGTVYIASDAVFDADQEDPAPSALYAVDAATGKERWHTDFGAGENSFSTPVVANGTVIVGVTNPDTNTGYYLATDATTGKERWRFALDKAPWEAAPGANGDLAYLTGGDDPVLIAVDATTGEERWRHKTAMALYPKPIVAENVLYFQSQDGHVTALDATTGTEHWRTMLGWGGAPVLADGMLYASGWGNLFALGSAGDPNAITLASQPAPPATEPEARTHNSRQRGSPSTDRSPGVIGSGSQPSGRHPMRRLRLARFRSSSFSAAAAVTARTQPRKRSIPGCSTSPGRVMSSSRRSSTTAHR